MAERFIFEHVLTGRGERDAAQAPGPFEQRRVRVDRFARVLETAAAHASASAAVHDHRRRVGASPGRASRRFRRDGSSETKTTTTFENTFFSFFFFEINSHLSLCDTTGL